MSNTSNINPAKRSKTSDGHTMSKIDVQNELAKQERDLIKEYKGYQCSCQRCGDKYEISTQKYNLADKIRLTKHLTQGACLSCSSWKTSQFHKSRNALLQITFDVQGTEIKALRVPQGFRPRKIIKTDENGKAILI